MASIDVMSDTTGRSIAEKMDAQNVLLDAQNALLSDKDIASNSALLSVGEKLETQNLLLTAIAGKDSEGAVKGLPVKDWGTVQSLVRMGLAPKVFSIGDQLICNHEAYGSLVWDVIGFDCDAPADSSKTHSMTLQLHAIPDALQFDAVEALYYAEEELAAGTYNFTLLADYAADYGGGKTYYFTLANPVPKGGQIVFNWGYQTQAASCNISTYESRTAAAALETVSVAEGSEGTALENTNHTHRARNGSGRWSQSAIRQWLNSEKISGAWWSPSNNYDRPAQYASTKDGFLKGLDSDFLAVIGAVTKRTVLNTVTDGGGIEATEDCMFLISLSEAYGGSEDEGTAYPYYSELSSLTAAGIGEDTNRIKYKNGTASPWWTRSCITSSGYGVRTIYPAGSISGRDAYNALGFAPACCII